MWRKGLRAEWEAAPGLWRVLGARLGELESPLRAEACGKPQAVRDAGRGAHSSAGLVEGGVRLGGRRWGES